MRRMDRYSKDPETAHTTRSVQNQELYESIGNNTKYASFSDVTNSNVIDISTDKNYRTREGYQQMREYQSVVETPRVKKELDDFRNIYQDHENRVYDINNILEQARKNKKDDLDDKRKLKNTSYNILASLNTEELEKYRRESHNKVERPGDDNLRELIDTIASKTLAGDINAASELLSDLMATSVLDKVEKPEEKEKTATKIEIEKTVETSKPEDTDKLPTTTTTTTISKVTTEMDKPVNGLEGADLDFYTRSMELSDQDFEMADEINEKGLSLGLKILIFLIILVIIGSIFYFVSQYI